MPVSVAAGLQTTIRRIWNRDFTFDSAWQMGRIIPDPVR